MKTIKSKPCSKEGCNNPRFSKGLCKYHYLQEIPNRIKKISEKGKIKKEDKKKLIEKDKEFYLEVWEDSDKSCFECNRGISEATLCNFHHILPKSKYPELRHEKRNIVILCCDCHNQVETNIDKCPQVKQLTKTTKEVLLENKKNS